MVLAKAFAEAAFGACAGDGVADGGAGGDEAGAGGRQGGVGRRVGGGGVFGVRRGVGPARGVEKDEGAGLEAAAGGADVVEISLAAQVLFWTEAHGWLANKKAATREVAAENLKGVGPGPQTTVRRLRPLARRAARTLRPPVVALRARKPILRARFFLCGRKVGSMAN